MVKKVFMYALKVLFTLSHMKHVDSRLLIQSVIELPDEAFLKSPPFEGAASGLKSLKALFISSICLIYIVLRIQAFPSEFP